MKNIEVDPNGDFEYFRIRIGIALRLMGSLYSSLGKMLTESNDPRHVCRTADEVLVMLNEGQPLAYSGVMTDDTHRLRQLAIAYMNVELADAYEETQRKADGQREGKKKNGKQRS